MVESLRGYYPSALARIGSILAATVCSKPSHRAWGLSDWRISYANIFNNSYILGAVAIRWALAKALPISSEPRSRRQIAMILLGKLSPSLITTVGAEGDS